MAYRTTAAKVRDLLMRDYDSVDEPSLTPHLETAYALTSRAVAYAQDHSLALSTAEAELVERWLAAHFYAMSDQPYEEEWTGKGKAAYQGRGVSFGKYLEASKYGQQAAILDRGGYLQALAAGRRTGRVEWLGKAPSQQTPYWQRD